MSPTSRGMLSPMRTQRPVGPLHAVDAAVVLLVQAVGPQRMQAHAVRIVAELGVGIGEEVAVAARVERLPVGAAVGALEHAAARQPDVEVRGVARVDDHRVQHRPVGRVLLRPLGPRLPHRVVVPAAHRLPRVAAVVGAEQALRRAAGVPDAGLARVAGRQPEHRVAGCARADRRSRTRAARRLLSTIARGRSSGTPSGRGGRCASRAASSCGRADRAPRAARCGRGTSGPSTDHDVARRVGRQDPHALARTDEQHRTVAEAIGSIGCGHVRRGHGENLPVG